MSQHKDDITRYLRTKLGWNIGAGGDAYYPAIGYPHLHARIVSGFKDHDKLVEWFSFLVVSSGGRKKSIQLVTDGREVAGGIDRIGDAALKSMATKVVRELRAPT